MMLVDMRPTGIDQAAALLFLEPGESPWTKLEPCEESWPLVSSGIRACFVVQISNRWAQFEEVKQRDRRREARVWAVD